MEGNLEIMSGIRDKLNLLLELQEDSNNPSSNDQPVIDKPKFAAHAAVASSGTCPATVPLGKPIVFSTNVSLTFHFRRFKKSVYHEQIL